MAVYFFNTLNRKKEEFKPLKDNEVGFYTCGPTVYNFAHIGNFRAYIFEDLLRRALKYHGYKVKQVMNLTDVDDKTIRDSQKVKMSLNDFTAQYKKAFFEDLKTLKIEAAEVYPAATDHIAEMIELIEVLMEKGYAYQASDKSVYFSIAKFPEYGKLAKIDMENQRAGVRIDTDEYEKDSVADFALWKAYSEADGDVMWDSPWGKGRPGWHIECSAMSMKYLGKTFDIHTGGVDNMFPHHEDEIAQSESANGCTYVNYWLHCAHLIVNGEKMSKSLGNFFTLRELIEKGYTGSEIRWVLLGTHYRKKLNFTFEACDQARTQLKKFSDMFIQLNKAQGGAVVEIDVLISETEEHFKRAIGDDLNISDALSAVYGLYNGVKKLVNDNCAGDYASLAKNDAEKIIIQFKRFNEVLDCLDFDVQEEIVEIDDDIQSLAEQRFQARNNRDWAEADRLRDELKERGYVVEDSKDGWNLKKID
ncbi:cysteine--tRNA ligase [Lentisphaerota bacterium WC36G]|nr:cysteine--tRNA ligase [Lentisphaerae bacterium WC36]